MSYTTFKFDYLRVEPKQISAGGSARSARYRHTGIAEGDEVPQMYIHQESLP